MWKPRNRAWLSAPSLLLCVLGQPLVACCDLQHDPLRVGRGQLIGLKTRFSCALQPFALIRRLGWHTSPVSPAHILNARRREWVPGRRAFVPQLSLGKNNYVERGFSCIGCAASSLASRS